MYSICLKLFRATEQNRKMSDRCSWKHTVIAVQYLILALFSSNGVRQHNHAQHPNMQQMSKDRVRMQLMSVHYNSCSNLRLMVWTMGLMAVSHALA